MANFVYLFSTALVRRTVSPTALSRLPSIGKSVPRDDEDLDALHADTRDLPDKAYPFLTSAVALKDDFKARAFDGYKTDLRWSRVIDDLERVACEPDLVKLTPLNELDEGLLYATQQSGEYWLCIPAIIEPEILRMAHGEGHLGISCGAMFYIGALRNYTPLYRTAMITTLSAQISGPSTKSNCTIGSIQ
ncbi:hypothetical protein N7462_001281 [Penicillium macrosclerotiorum]|uniref:uncharacterized protein n=1 Tax=Penicillium macrosclerotiorum TaxID=303699 RepID=UPI0025469276|nr:uncharacterized protein N7462_001281 [Penicillium macrosclerotiorum]KAJ5691858.1 hypothetical protein N7462_001281 [Penicillium macrosclerotiorum]